MGGVTFETLAVGSDVRQVFENATARARYENGAGGYSGTIAEKDSFVVVEGTPLAFLEAKSLASKLIHDQDPRIDDKWGPAGAIPVVLETRDFTVKVPSGMIDDWQGEGGDVVLAVLNDQKLIGKGETVKAVKLVSYTQVPQRWTGRANFTNGLAVVTVNKPGAPFTRREVVSIVVDGPVEWDTRDVWQAAAAAKAKLKAGERIVCFRAAKTEPKVKVEAQATKGKTETRYVIEGVTTWETGFATQAEARAKAVELAPKRASHSNRNSFSIVAVTKRVDGSPLVVVTPTVTKSVAEVEVTITKRPPGAAVDAWLFFGWASS